MVILVNTSGHLLVEYLIIKHSKITVHALLEEERPLHPLWETILTVNQVLWILLTNKCTTSMTHCGTDMIATVVLTAALTLSSHGSTDS